MARKLFTRATFSPIPQKTAAKDGDSIRTLPDLINFNAQSNPDALFCIQAETKATNAPTSDKKVQFGSRQITFLQLKNSVDACSVWIEQTIKQVHGSGDEPSDARPRPLALYIESDVGLFIHLSALLALNIPVVLLSARLNAASVRHLVKETNAQCILVSKRTESTISGSVEDLASVRQVQPYSRFFEPAAGIEGGLVRALDRGAAIRDDDCNALILHSSGTTGLPKPIRLAHRYLLGYAACHEFSDGEDVDWCNVSTLPLYHGFGLLAPCLSLSIGLTCCLPPSSVIPAAHSTLELLALCRAGSLMTVPSILEDIVNLDPDERADALRLLRPLHFVAVGGGPLRREVGDALAAERVNLLNHYGATEIGAIAPIFRPGPECDRRYLRLRRDLGLELRPVGPAAVPDAERRYQLVGFPVGWDRPFEIQDEILKRPGPPSARVEIQILGRHDDLIVLKTGEKVSPRGLEQALQQDAWIKTAVCVGQGMFELAVLVEHSAAAPADSDTLAEHVWRLISQINPTMDQHAQISSKHAVIIMPADKTIPRSDKGSVMRREVHAVFEQEIAAAYEALELETFVVAAPLQLEALEDGVRAMVVAVSGKGTELPPHADFFELGMDSLQATRLARFLTSSLSKLPRASAKELHLSAAFIYRHPTLASLAGAIRAALSDEPGLLEEASVDRETQMLALADELTQAVETLDDDDAAAADAPETVVLLTGSTGNLGAHVLAHLAARRDVSRIICLNRAGPDGTVEELRVRQERANAAAGVALDAAAWRKAEFVGADMQAPGLGLTPTQRDRLAARVTHTLHLAWPMDFNRTLPSFRPQLDALAALVGLARAARRHRFRESCCRAPRPRLVFASSIAVVRHHAGQRAPAGSLVPEERLRDPRVATAMGYAEAKWVCEELLARVGERHAAELEPAVVRIGQLSGPEEGEGVWKPEEHIPALVKAAQMVGAFPALQGDFSWLPVDRAARALSDILLQPGHMTSRVYHLENPVRQPLADLGAVATHELRLPEGPIPFDIWLARVVETGYAPSLAEFFRNDFKSLADGSTSLDTRKTRQVSPHLRGSSGITKNLLITYLQRWRRMGVLA